MKYIYVIFIFFFPLLIFAQGINNLWIMGYPGGGGGINLDFSVSILNVTLDTSRKMDIDETNGEICDKNGNLLFYSNGVWIANALNDTLENGSGLNPSFYTTENANYNEGLYIEQANLIIPFSSDSNKYYLLHGTIDDPSTFCALYLYYSIIDMKGDSGRGAVIEKNKVLLNDSLVPGGHLTACKHANGRDWWIVAHSYNTNLYYKYLVTPSGIQGPDTQSIGEVRGAGLGQCVFSPDGKLFAYYDAANNLDIFDFDRCTDNFALKTYIDINDSAFATGAAFSPNSQVLYVSTGYEVDQFDMNASDIATSKTTVLILDSTSSGFFLSQLALDGKIYIASSGVSQTLHVINNPDVLGTGCNACHDCVILPALNAWTIANHPNYFLEADSGSVCDSLTSVQSLSVQSSKLETFPNPVPIDRDEITFNYNVSSQHGSLSIYNAEGKEIVHYILPQWSGVQHLKLPVLASGIYLARLTQGNNISCVTFVKE